MNFPEASEAICLTVLDKLKEKLTAREPRLYTKILDMVATGPKRYREGKKFTALQLACCNELTKVALRLIKDGADPNSAILGLNEIPPSDLMHAIEHTIAIMTILNSPAIKLRLTPENKAALEEMLIEIDTLAARAGNTAAVTDSGKKLSAPASVNISAEAERNLLAAEGETVHRRGRRRAVALAARAAPRNNSGAVAAAALNNSGAAARNNSGAVAAAAAAANVPLRNNSGAAAVNGYNRWYNRWAAEPLSVAPEEQRGDVLFRAQIPPGVRFIGYSQYLDDYVAVLLEESTGNVTVKKITAGQMLQETPEIVTFRKPSSEFEGTPYGFRCIGIIQFKSGKKGALLFNGIKLLTYSYEGGSLGYILMKSGVTAMPMQIAGSRKTRRAVRRRRRTSKKL